MATATARFPWKSSRPPAPASGEAVEAVVARVAKVPQVEADLQGLADRPQQADLLPVARLRPLQRPDKLGSSVAHRAS